MLQIGVDSLIIDHVWPIVFWLSPMVKIINALRYFADGVKIQGRLSISLSAKNIAFADGAAYF